MRFPEAVQRGNGEAGPSSQDHRCRQPDPPPPPGADPDFLIALHKMAAKEAVIMYAQKHDDFCDLLIDAATDHLFDTILTDGLLSVPS